MNQDISERLSGLIKSLIEEGYCSHAFLECGFLNKEKPSYTQSFPRDQNLIYFDLASLTKALATGPMILNSFSQNELSQDLRSFLNWLPEAFPKTTLSELMSHTSGLPAWLNFWINRLDSTSISSSLKLQSHKSIREVIERTDWNKLKVSKEDCYSDVGFILAGMILEMKVSKSIDNAFDDFKSSLNFNDEGIRFYSTNELKNQFCSTAYCHLRQRWVQGEVHDENAAALGGCAGHAGLIATGKGLSNYIKYLAASEYGRRYFIYNHDSFERMNPMFGLRPGDDMSSYPFGRGKSIGHLGFVGTSFWIDWDSESYGIFLCNRTISRRISKKIKFIRRVVFSLFQDMIDKEL